MIETGQTAPSFTLPTNGNGTLTVPTGKPLVLYFYPKDNTTGCTTEAIDFTAAKPDFDELGVEIAGVSKDSVKRHDGFIEKHSLGITLASDEDQAVMKKYGVWVEKKMYGRTHMGAQRSTFLLDGKGKVLEAWHRVKVKGHVEEVLAAAREHFGK